MYENAPSQLIYIKGNVIIMQILQGNAAPYSTQSPAALDSNLTFDIYFGISNLMVWYVSKAINASTFDTRELV